MLSREQNERLYKPVLVKLNIDDIGTLRDVLIKAKNKAIDEANAFEVSEDYNPHELAGWDEYINKLAGLDKRLKRVQNKILKAYTAEEV